MENIPEVGQLMFEQSAKSILDLEKSVTFFVKYSADSVRPASTVHRPTSMALRPSINALGMHWVRAVLSKCVALAGFGCNGERGARAYNGGLGRSP